MTPTNLQLATHYKLNKDTVQKWKKTRPDVYEALKDHYLNIPNTCDGCFRDGMQDHYTNEEFCKHCIIYCSEDKDMYNKHNQVEENTISATNDTDSYLSESDIKAYLSEGRKIEVSEYALKIARAIISECNL